MIADINDLQLSFYKGSNHRLSSEGDNFRSIRNKRARQEIDDFNANIKLQMENQVELENSPDMEDEEDCISRGEELTWGNQQNPQQNPPFVLDESRIKKSNLTTQHNTAAANAPKNSMADQLQMLKSDSQYKAPSQNMKIQQNQHNRRQPVENNEAVSQPQQYQQSVGLYVSGNESA